MNAIDYAIKNVQQIISEQILQEAFIAHSYSSVYYPISIEHVIRDKVIDSRVMTDCNLLGGVQITIDDMDLIPPTYDNEGIQVYKIPKNRTDGRSITAVLSVGFTLNTGTRAYGRRQSSALMQKAHTLADAHNGAGANSTSNITIVGDNTLLVKEEARRGYIASLRCLVANDENMGNLKPATYPAFAKLVEYATKAYVYNNLAIKIGRGQLSGGADLGIFKDTVDGYADANQMYEEYREESWASIAFMDDQESYHRHLRMTIR